MISVEDKQVSNCNYWVVISNVRKRMVDTCQLLKKSEVRSPERVATGIDQLINTFILSEVSFERSTLARSDF